MTNRKSYMGFPTSYRWSAYVTCKFHFAILRIEVTRASRSLCDSWATCFWRTQYNFNQMREFCISQGTAVTFLRCGWQVHSHMKFCMNCSSVRCLANQHLSPKFGELWFGVPQYCVETYISPSPIHLLFFVFTQNVFVDPPFLSSDFLATAGAFGL